MARSAVFFDRDNTLIIGNDYLGDPAKVVLVSGAAEAVSRARALGFATVVVSNQSGVARGMFGEDDVRAVNARMDEMLRAEHPNAIIDRHEFCPFHPQAPVEKYRVDSDSRKPRPGMLLKAAAEMGLDLGRSWIIGDAARDVEAGRAAGCHTILFNDRSLPASPAARAEPRVPPEFIVASLREAMDQIAWSDGTAAAPPSQRLAEESEPSESTSRNQPFDEDPATTGAAAPEAAPAEASIATSLARVPRASADEGAPPLDSGALPPLADVAPASNGSRLETLTDQILQELRRRHEQPVMDFSVSKLLAGIVQVIAVAVAFLAYLNRDSGSVEPLLLFAIFLQAMTSSLLIMSRQR